MTTFRITSYNVCYTKLLRISTYELYRLIFAKAKDQDLLKKVIENEALPIGKRVKLSAYLIKI